MNPEFVMVESVCEEIDVKPLMEKVKINNDLNKSAVAVKSKRITRSVTKPKKVIIKIKPIPKQIITEPTKKVDASIVNVDIDNNLPKLEEPKKKRGRKKLLPYAAESNQGATNKIAQKDTYTEKHECVVCKMVFTTVNKLFAHIQKHSAGSETTKLFQCNVCQLFFNEIEKLEIHTRTHFDDDPYVCGICADVFWDVYILTSHMRNDHKELQSQFTCRYCNMKFQEETDFVEHDHEHKNEKPYDCSECGEGFSSFSLFKSHKRTHFGDNPYNCNKCQRSFTRSEDLHTHLRIHKGLSVFECRLCDRMFAHSKNLSNHVKKAHKGNFQPDELLLIDFVVDCEVNERIANSVPKREEDEPGEIYNLDVVAMVKTLSNEPPPLIPLKFKAESDILQPKPVPQFSAPSKTPQLLRKYKCPLCDLSFVKMKSLEIHCKRNHDGKYEIGQLKEIEKNVEQEELDRKLLEASIADTNAVNSMITGPTIAVVIPRKQDCPSCEIVFDTRTELVQHVKKEHNGDKPYKCAECEMTFSKLKTLSEHVVVHIEKRHKCKYCGLTFMQYHSLQKHLKRHEGTEQHTCTVCNIPYTHLKNLKRHMRIHAEGKPHKCLYCDKSFAQSCDRIKHMRIHTGERPYVCKICGKTFAHLTSIKKHNFVHSGERPFQCTTCGKSFQHNSNLVVHTRTHTGERPYKCKLCEKSFYASGHYADHMRIHAGTKNYKCAICDKGFVHQSSFQKHKKTHSGEKPHHCVLCDRRFSQPGHYREHMRIHTGEKPYACDVCAKAFRRSDALQCHMKTHLNEKTKPKKKSAVKTDLDAIETIQYVPNIAEIKEMPQQQQENHHQFIIHQQIPEMEHEEIQDIIKIEETTLLNVGSSITVVRPHHSELGEQSFNTFSYNFQL